MKRFKSAKKLILHTCEKYWDAKTSYKKLIIYCFMEQGYNFPLSVEAILNCYSTETIRRTFQNLKKTGEIRVAEETQKAWDEEEKIIHAYYSPKKKVKEHIDMNEYMAHHVITDPMTGKPVDFAH